ncbi:MAG: hypothetical protein WD844_00745 [Thermoleophilaceae bacterium]
MSFLIDPPLLYLNGQAYARAAPGRERELGAATVAVFWVVSGALYLNQAWTRPLWRACRARSGRDWMINSGVLRIDEQRVGAGTHVVALLIFATYPLWLWLGVRRGARARG